MNRKKEPFEWRGFRHVTSPQGAAEVLIDLFGDHALDAAAQCGLEAHCAGRDDDFRFWVEVFRLLQALRSGSPGHGLHEAAQAGLSAEHMSVAVTPARDRSSA